MSLKLAVLSDLHFEWMSSLAAVKNFIGSLTSEVDVLALCGDISSGEFLGRDLTFLSEHFANSEVLYVPGNHEYYGSSFKKVSETIEKVEAAKCNFIHLKSGVTKTIKGQRFIGCTLWYKETKETFGSYLKSTTPGALATKGMRWADFQYIEESFEIFNEARNDAYWLHNNVQKDDVVLTHMLPSAHCVSARWRDNYSNIFFVHEVSDIIYNREPKLWLHGHTHDSMDHTIDKTRIMCNPHGYYPHVQPGFVKNLVIDI